MSVLRHRNRDATHACGRSRERRAVDGGRQEAGVGSGSMTDTPEPASPQPAPTLTARQRAALKARAHALEPVVRIGHAGVTDAMVAEIDRALEAHELIKVKIG